MRKVEILPSRDREAGYGPVVTTPSLDFCCKASDSYYFRIVDSYESPLFIDTKKVTVALHLS